jgi:hypothetical protein
MLGIATVGLTLDDPARMFAVGDISHSSAAVGECETRHDGRL